MIDPIAFSIGPIDVHWYGISYGLSLAMIIGLLIWMNKKQPFFKNSDQILDFAFWTFLLGVVLGGRLGYILFYNLGYYLEHPLKLFAVWEGGMSFHGGLIGAAIVAYFWAKKNKLSYLKLADRVIVPASVAPALTRIANFINQELVGRPIENPNWNWLGIDYGDGILRYPSQFFQAGEAVITFLILLLIYRKNPRPGALIASYLVLYGLLRFFTEFFRQPDSQVGFLWGGLTMGQLLSVGMVMLGISVFTITKKKQPNFYRG